MDDLLNEYWSKSLVLLKKSFTDVVYDTWVKTLEPFYMDDGRIVLKTKISFYKTMIEKRYLSEITNSLCAVSGGSFDVKIICDEDVDKLNKGGLSSESLFSETLLKSNLKSKYVFETFVRGNSNELAYAAALAVSEEPGNFAYNPLFLYGGVGLGKTHLMHSIGNRVLEKNSEAKVLYVSTETFANELVASIKDRKNQDFRNKYRDIDVLLIDDVQFLSEKEGTQDEFFHTFNTLYNANKQIVISSDQPPKRIKSLEDRLSSRFGSGLIVDIIAPEFETRTAILEKKAEMYKINLPKEVTLFIAKNIAKNIRELEGALNKVNAYARLSKLEITLELAQNLLKDLIHENESENTTFNYEREYERESNEQVSIDLIQQVVADYYSVTKEDICSKKRSQNITHPRQIAMYLSRKMIDASLPKIGAAFGGRDHSTVIHGCDKVTEELEKNLNFRDVILELENKIKFRKVHSSMRA